MGLCIRGHRQGCASGGIRWGCALDAATARPGSGASGAAVLAGRAAALDPRLRWPAVAAPATAAYSPCPPGCRVFMADEDVANAVQPHPHLPVLATSGIESTIKARVEGLL